MDCPVCPRRGLADDVNVCPNCGTDLGPVRRVRELARAIAGAPAVSATVPRTRWHAGPLTIVAALLVSAAAIGFTTGRLAQQPTRAADNAPRRAGDTGAAKTDRQSTGESPAVEESSRSPQIAALHAALRGKEGLALRPAGPGLLVALENGGFASASAVMGAAQLQLLEAVADAVAAAGTRLRVEVKGYTDGRPVRRGRRWQSNAALARARAETAAHVLTRRAAAVPILVHTSSADAPPFHDSSAGPRSRTVVLFIAPAAGPLTP